MARYGYSPVSCCWHYRGGLGRRFLLHFFYPIPNRAKEFDDEQVERDTDEESDDTHEVFCNKEDQEYDWSWELEWLSDDSGIQKISLKCMDDKEHRDDSDDDTPARVFDYSCEEDRDTTDKDSENRHKTWEKCDTSERENIGEYETPIETELPIEEAYDDEPDECQNSICNGYFTLSTEYQTKTLLYFLEQYLNISVEKCKWSLL